MQEEREHRWANVSSTPGDKLWDRDNFPLLVFGSTHLQDDFYVEKNIKIWASKTAEMIELHLLNVTSPFIFFWRVEFSAWRRSSSPSTGMDAGLGGGLDAEAAPPSFFRHWFSCSSCSICVHSWKKKCYHVKITIMIWSFYSVWTTQTLRLTLESSAIRVLFCSLKSSSWLWSFPWSISFSLSKASTSYTEK